MLKVLTTAAILLVATAIPLAGLQAGEMDKPVAARKAAMKLRSFYLGPLGAMAKGKIAYDAKKAQASANSLLAVTTLDGSGMWLPGSGNDKLGTATRAKPEIWQPKSGIGGKAKDLKVALEGLVKTAGSGLEGLRGSIGAVGKACGSCHKAFRAKKK